MGGREGGGQREGGGEGKTQTFFLRARHSSKCFIIISQGLSWLQPPNPLSSLCCEKLWSPVLHGDNRLGGQDTALYPPEASRDSIAPFHIHSLLSCPPRSSLLLPNYLLPFFRLCTRLSMDATIHPHVLTLSTCLSLYLSLSQPVLTTEVSWTKLERQENRKEGKRSSSEGRHWRCFAPVCLYLREHTRS